MTQRFDELYIRRGEHQQIVTYYKKLVVHIYRRLRALQEELDEAESTSKTGSAETKKTLENIDPQPIHSNVVQVDFRRLRRSSPV